MRQDCASAVQAVQNRRKQYLDLAWAEGVDAAVKSFKRRCAGAPAAVADGDDSNIVSNAAACGQVFQTVPPPLELPSTHLQSCLVNPDSVKPDVSMIRSCDRNSFLSQPKSDR